VLKERGGKLQIDLAHPTEGRVRVSTGYRLDQRVLAEVRHKEVELAILKGASVVSIRSMLMVSAIGARTEVATPQPLRTTLTQRKACSPVGGGISLGELFKLALPVLYADHKSLRSVKGNFEVLCSHFGESRDVRSIDTDECDDFINACRNKEWLEKGLKRKLSSKTINRYNAVLSKLLRFALDRRYINAMPKITRQKERGGRIRYLKPEEETKVLAALAASDHPFDAIMLDLVPVLLDTGLRHTEAYMMKDADIDLRMNTLAVWENKADHPRTVPMTARARAILTRRMGTGWPFGDISEKGEKLGLAVDRADDRWEKMRAAIGLAGDKEFVIHALRHTTCTRLFQAGRDPRRIQKFMGHKSIQTTLKYEHMAPESLKGMETALEAHLTVESSLHIVS
jgi:integrase